MPSLTASVPSLCLAIAAVLCACSDPPSALGIDAGDVHDAFDASDTAPVDAAPDIVPFDAGPPGPRSIAPISSSTVTSQQPTLHWISAPGTDGTRVTLCRDRAMSTGCLAPITDTGASTRPPRTLAPGVWFWQLVGTMGTSAVTAPSAVWQFTVGALSAPVDASWGSVLDVNGDGFADIAASAIGVMSGTGRVDVFLGSASGVSTTPATMLNGLDGTSAAFGSSIASAGDVNGDGFADLIVGAYTVMNDTGRAYLFFGAASGLSTMPGTVLTGPDGDDGFFGGSVAGIGDVNGDGFADIAIGAATASGAGTVNVFLGSASGPSAIPSMTLTGTDGDFEMFGAVVAGAGDVNGDGFADLAVGAPGAMGVGEAFVYLGSVSGIAPTPAVTLAGSDGPMDAFGGALANAGDVNGDGYADMVIAAPGAMMHTGRAYVHLGGAGGVSPHAATVLTGSDGPLGGFGAALSGAGDVNGDGYADVIIGASGAETATGSAYVYTGSAAGLGATPASSLAGPDGAMGSFGDAVAITGDVNGDGFADVAIGATGAPTDVGHMGMGRTYVFAGGALGVGTTPTATLSIADTVAGYFGSAIAARSRSTAPTRCAVTSVAR